MPEGSSGIASTSSSSRGAACPGIAERTHPTQLAGQLSEHRAEMNRAILDEGGTVMQFVGDAVMACFGAPVPLDDHADRAVCAARAMLERQRELNEKWLAAIRV